MKKLKQILKFCYAAWQCLWLLALVGIFRKKDDIKKLLRVLFTMNDLFFSLLTRYILLYYDGKHPKHHLWTGHYQFIIDNIAPQSRVLDVGTGASVSYTQALAERCAFIDCCDVSEELISKSIAENKFANVNYFVMDITKELPTKKYDVVILSHVLEHLIDPRSVLQHLQSITSKVIIRLPRYDDHWIYLVKKDLGFHYFKDRDHKKEYNLEDAKQLVASSGWRVCQALNDVDVKIVAEIYNLSQK